MAPGFHPREGHGASLEPSFPSPPLDEPETAKHVVQKLRVPLANAELRSDTRHVFKDAVPLKREALIGVVLQKEGGAGGARDSGHMLTVLNKGAQLLVKDRGGLRIGVVRAPPMRRKTAYISSQVVGLECSSSFHLVQLRKR